MSFHVPRSQLLNLLADSMLVPHDRRSAFLGRFQHLQRLSLIEGINPGRGKQAEYQAHQVLLIAIAFQMLQLGLSPERAVKIIKENQEQIRLAIRIAIENQAEISPSLLWFDPGIISPAIEGYDVEDLADATFTQGDGETAMEMFKRYLVDGGVTRLSFISVSNTLGSLLRAIEGVTQAEVDAQPTDRTREFLTALKDWHNSSDTDSVA